MTTRDRIQSFAGNGQKVRPTFSAAGLYLVGVRYEDRWGLPVPANPFLSGAMIL